MFKNKDGSYNKVSIILTLSIALIIIGMIGSSLLQVSEVPTTDIPLVIIIISLFGIICFGIYRRQTSKKISKCIPAQLPTKTIPTPDISKLGHQIKLNLQKDVIKPDLIKSKINILSLAITSVIGFIGIVISWFMLQAIISSLPSITNPELASTQTAIIDNVSTAFNFLAIGLFIGAAILIISMVGKLAGGINNHYTFIFK